MAWPPSWVTTSKTDSVKLYTIGYVFAGRTISLNFIPIQFETTGLRPRRFKLDQLVVIGCFWRALPQQEQEQLNNKKSNKMNSEQLLIHKRVLAVFRKLNCHLGLILADYLQVTSNTVVEVGRNAPERTGTEFLGPTKLSTIFRFCASNLFVPQICRHSNSCRNFSLWPPELWSDVLNPETVSPANLATDLFLNLFAYLIV